MRAFAITVILLTGALGACATKRANECPTSKASHCVNGEVCSMDREKGCQVCMCRRWDDNDGELKTEPDDPNPPFPVH